MKHLIDRKYYQYFYSLKTFYMASRFTRRSQWQPTPVLLPGKSHGWRSLVGCSPKVSKSQTRLSDFFHFSLSCIGEGNGNPLQYSLPGESQGQGSLVGCHLWGHTESDTTEATWQQTYMTQRGIK